MSTCPQCGQENKEEARFCIKCGASIGPPVQAAAPPPAAEPAPPPAAAPSVPPQAAPTLAQPAAPAQPTPPAQPPVPPAQPAQPIYQQPPAQAPYAAPPGAGYAAAPAYGAPAKTRSVAFWIGAGTVSISGFLVLISSFLAWIEGPMGVITISGWDFVTDEMVRLPNYFFDYGNGYPIFSGLTSLILGILIVIIGILILVTRSRGLASLAILFSIFALGIAITNLTSILRDPTGAGIGLGVGMYIFLIFSVLGLIGGGMAASG